MHKRPLSPIEHESTSPARGRKQPRSDGAGADDRPAPVSSGGGGPRDAPRAREPTTSVAPLSPIADADAPRNRPEEPPAGARRRRPSRFDQPPPAEPSDSTSPRPVAEAKQEGSDDAKSEQSAAKLKPDFGLSGNLKKETSLVNGVEVKYVEPPEARLPTKRWRLYVFKGSENIDILYIHRKTCFLVGKDRRVVDIPLDHPSISKQHAVLQYRQVTVDKGDGTVRAEIRPYLMDLESSNGTFLNGEKIEPLRYYQLLEKDVIRFASSSREFVALQENSAASS